MQLRPNRHLCPAHDLRSAASDVKEAAWLDIHTRSLASSASWRSINLDALDSMTVNRAKQAGRRALSNQEVVVLAAYLVGAQSTSADTEDIAMKAHELAPGRFTWRKYKEQINMDAIRKRLWDATKPEKGAYLIGTEKKGWRLTKAGFDFARRQMAAGDPTQPTKARASQTERAAQAREVRRMLSEDAFQKVRLGQIDSITKSEAERFFRIDDYVTGKDRVAKIERFRIIAANNSELERAIDLLSRLVREK